MKWILSLALLLALYLPAFAQCKKGGCSKGGMQMGGQTQMVRIVQAQGYNGGMMMTASPYGGQMVRVVQMGQYNGQMRQVTHAQPQMRQIPMAPVRVVGAGGCKS